MKDEQDKEGFLTKAEINDVHTLVRELIERDLTKLDWKEYLISEILVDYWEEASCDGTYPKRFKKSAKLGKISQVFWVKTKSDNNELYRVESDRKHR